MVKGAGLEKGAERTKELGFKLGELLTFEKVEEIAALFTPTIFSSIWEISESLNAQFEEDQHAQGVVRHLRIHRHHLSLKADNSGLLEIESEIFTKNIDVILTLIKPFFNHIATTYNYPIFEQFVEVNSELEKFQKLLISKIKTHPKTRKRFQKYGLLSFDTAELPPSERIMNPILSESIHHTTKKAKSSTSFERVNKSPCLSLTLPSKSKITKHSASTTVMKTGGGFLNSTYTTYEPIRVKQYTPKAIPQYGERRYISQKKIYQPPKYQHVRALSTNTRHSGVHGGRVSVIQRTSVGPIGSPGIPFSNIVISPRLSITQPRVV